MVAGTIAQLWRWPVKSMAGEPVEAVHVDARGVGGDRAHVVRTEHKGQTVALTARQAPGLLAWAASYPGLTGGALAEPPHATVVAPDGRTFGWQDPGLAAALAGDLGRELELHRDPEGVQDVPGTLLLTLETTRRALADELGEEIDLRRFRPNLHLETTAGPWEELGWEGGRLRFAGGVELALLHPCERCAIPTRHPDTREKWPGLLRHLAARHDTCFGINARVLVPGRVQRGEALELVAREPVATGASARDGRRASRS